MWEAQLVTTNPNIQKIRLLENGRPLPYEDVIRYWQSSDEFRNFYLSILKETPFEAFFWEHPPVTRSNARQTYEFVLVNRPQLAGVRAEPRPFAQQFRSHMRAQASFGLKI